MPRSPSSTGWPQRQVTVTSCWREPEHAAIVNTCSIASTSGLPARAVYSASKGALLSLTLAGAAAVRPRKRPRRRHVGRPLDVAGPHG
ncbi:MAG TPA: SDR family NAD(P)-dependent oxidoreductase [Propionibacteriaceae bacterium]|nr:SDR family NAD(P)-dependent oxidoreductase [Propionibacteriaceae bacterium]